MLSFSIPASHVLTDEQISTIYENSYLISCKKGESIFRQGHPISYVMLVKSGLVKLYKEHEKDKHAIIKIGVPNEFLGLTSGFDGNTYQISASSLEPSEVVQIRMDVFTNVIGQNGAYAMEVLRMLSSESLSYVNSMIDITHRQIPGRIAGVMLFFSNVVYKSREFVLPLSRQELADLVCTTKETVSRTLTEFRNDRIIEIKDKKIKLKSIDLIQMLHKIG